MKPYWRPASLLLVVPLHHAKAFTGAVRCTRCFRFDSRRPAIRVVGENGAGKSTLIKIITGAVAADSGTLKVAGKEVEHNDPALARSLKIAAIYQQPSLFPHLTVTENIACGLWKRQALAQGRLKARKRQAIELLQRAGASIDPDRIASTLTMPEQQMVEIAKAIGTGARILIMDEPTASLTDRKSRACFKSSPCAPRAGIIDISHRLDEIFAIADRITVLRDGEAIATVPVGEVDRATLIEMMVGRAVDAIFPKREVAPGEVALELRNVSCDAVGLHDISLSVRSGEIVGLAGLVGAGRTELAEVIFGLRPLDAGEILVRGESVRITHPTQAIEAGIAYLPEDRRRHGVVLEMPIAANWVVWRRSKKYPVTD